MTEITKEPVIRFKGFSDAWEQRKLGEVAIIRTGYPFDSNQFDDSGEYLVITNGNIQDDSATVDSSLGNHITIDDSNILREYLLNIDDILVTMDGTVGRTAKVAEKEQILAQRVGRITANEEAEFLYQWLNTGSFSKAMSELSHGGTIKHISLDEIRSFTSLIPESIEEKKKIGSFFRNLDNLITLHQRKFEKLQNVKKAMLEKMFPKNGSNVPEIRFVGFTDTWEQHKLSDIATMKARIGWQGLTQKEFLDEGDYYLITGTDFNNGKIDFSQCHYISKDRYDQDSNIQIRNDDVLITKDGTIGKVAYIKGLDKPGTLNAGVFVIRGRDKNISNLYLYHYLAAPFLLNYADKQATGGTIKHLNQNVLVGFPVPLPPVDEQQKIGEYFSRIDQLITLHQRKLEKLKNIKKACLEKMFV